MLTSFASLALAILLGSSASAPSPVRAEGKLSRDVIEVSVREEGGHRFVVGRLYAPRTLTPSAAKLKVEGLASDGSVTFSAAGKVKLPRTTERYLGERIATFRIEIPANASGSLRVLSAE
ncbi:MAG: hypothetical protein JNJ88_00975 [Planctomycetes bacterium]|nr:hypothetical protein [Planctomycetota bacterium]